MAKPIGHIMAAMFHHPMPEMAAHWHSWSDNSQEVGKMNMYTRTCADTWCCKICSLWKFMTASLSLLAFITVKSNMIGHMCWFWTLQLYIYCLFETQWQYFCIIYHNQICKFVTYNSPVISQLNSLGYGCSLQEYDFSLTTIWGNWTQLNNNNDFFHRSYHTNIWSGV